MRVSQEKVGIMDERWINKVHQDNQTAGNLIFLLFNNQMQLCDSAFQLLNSTLLKGNEIYDSMQQHEKNKYSKHQKALLDLKRTIYKIESDKWDETNSDA